jgi:hypothetical protein
MIDMRDDAEVSGQLDRHKAVHYAGAGRVGQSVEVFLVLVLVLDNTPLAAAAGI